MFGGSKNIIRITAQLKAKYDNTVMWQWSNKEPIVLLVAAVKYTVHLVFVLALISALTST